MITMEKQEFKSNKKLDVSLNNNFLEASKDKDFCKLITTLEVDKDVAKKYTSSLQDTIEELHHCKKCKGLYECQNQVNGHVSYPEKDFYGNLVFVSKPCKYLKESLKEEKNCDSLNNQNARMKDIDYEDKKRIKLINWVVKFYEEYSTNKNMKGLYLNGSFGAGKTFIISALFNELSINKKIRTEVVYFPELLRSLKDNWSSYEDKISYYEDVDLLLIDDIGAEKVTEWGRDEVLGTILQYRMDKGKTTFFTSNLTIEELEHHLSLTNNNVDMVKARRIIERVNQLTEKIELVSDNRRK